MKLSHVDHTLFCNVAIYNVNNANNYMSTVLEPVGGSVTVAPLYLYSTLPEFQSKLLNTLIRAFPGDQDLNNSTQKAMCIDKIYP